MKLIKAPDHLMKLIEELESKKAFNTMNANMKSRIIGYSKDSGPCYFVRADYFKDEKLSKQPQEYWSIPNSETPYFIDRRGKMESLKALSKIEKDMGLKTSTDFYYKQIKDRCEFLLEPRRINPEEYDERIANERIQFIKRE
jgi:hypothetical protein